MANFKFNIGDLIALASDLEALRSGLMRAQLEARPQQLVTIPFMTVVERRLSECSGGVQIHYLCRYREPSGRFGAEWLNEIELAPFPQKELTDLHLEILRRFPTT